MSLCSVHLVLGQDRTDSKKITTADSNNPITMVNAVGQSITQDC